MDIPKNIVPHINAILDAYCRLNKAVPEERQKKGFRDEYVFSDDQFDANDALIWMLHHADKLFSAPFTGEEPMIPLDSLPDGELGRFYENIALLVSDVVGHYAIEDNIGKEMKDPSLHEFVVNNIYPSLKIQRIEGEGQVMQKKSPKKEETKMLPQKTSTPLLKQRSSLVLKNMFGNENPTKPLLARQSTNNLFEGSGAIEAWLKNYCGTDTQVSADAQGLKQAAAKGRE